MHMIDYYIILDYGRDPFKYAVENIKNQGVAPTDMDNLGSSYQHIFFGLKDISDFLKVNPQYGEKNMLAVKPSRRNFPKSRNVINITHRSGLPLKLVYGFKKKKLLNVSDAEFFDLK